MGLGGKLLNRQKGIELLKEAIRIDAEFSDAYALLSTNYTYIGISAANPKHWLDSATILAKKATRISPDRERGYMALAYVNQWEGLHDEQRKWLLKAHEIKPFSTVFDIVENYTRKNDYEKAYTWVLKAEKYDPSELGYYAAKGFIFFNLGMLDSLKNTIDRARRIKNVSADIDELTLDYYAVTRKQDEYIKLSKKIFALDEKEFAYNMGIFYTFQRDWKMADSSLSVSSRPDEMDIGLANIHLGNTEQGKMILEKVIQERKRFLGFEDYWHYYDISRCYAAMQDSRYIEYLNKAFQKGWHWYSWFEHDPFLDLVRETPEFKKLRQKIYERNEGFKAELYAAIRRYEN